jgi:hypothetical protein
MMRRGARVAGYRRLMQNPAFYAATGCPANSGRKSRQQCVIANLQQINRIALYSHRFRADNQDWRGDVPQPA